MTITSFLFLLYPWLCSHFIYLEFVSLFVCMQLCLLVWGMQCKSFSSLLIRPSQVFIVTCREKSQRRFSGLRWLQCGTAAEWLLLFVCMCVYV